MDPNNKRKNEQNEIKSNKIAKTNQPQSNLRGKKYTVFILHNGKEMKFDIKRNADLYEQENPEMIRDIIPFDTETAYKTYQSQKSESFCEHYMKDNDLNEEEKKALARIKQHQRENAPYRTISIHYTTTTFSKAVVLIFDILDTYKKPQWNFKARDFVQTMQAYAFDTSTDIAGRHTMEIIRNLKTTERRDLNAKNDNKSDKKRGYVNYKTYSHFILPSKNVFEIACENQETEYIQTVLMQFGEEMKRIMQSKLYVASLRQHVASYSKKLERLTFEPVKGPTLHQAVGQCKVLVEPIISFTDFIIRDRVPLLRNILADNDDVKPKYESPPLDKS